ncbi:hypothetical protein RM697_12925 [Ichthyenterobacterium sp. W332]|uniref:Uncharacterized protein n=1 Tax=Microcosmobacter mediterraneus TaxID=3075607 RepID=A0ABU2YP29_9FLAO|nr:hypothetical protein [Ichthyenterobacterium sp. W332]MDT0559560.1 hypothetical protein [Ichthyenterobacterium sp. W332]
MRTNNSKVKNVIISVYFILILTAITTATFSSFFKDITGSPFLTVGIIISFFLFLLVILYWIARYFEYDSDGLNIVITNRGLLLADYFNYREHQIEFEKENLISFKINNYILYKTLVVNFKNSRGSKRREVFNITLVSKKKRKYIKQSLSKMIKYNRKLKLEINE